MKFLKNNMLFTSQQHPFHLVNPSPWPIFVSIWLPLLLLQAVTYMHAEYGVCLSKCLFFQILEKMSIVILLISVIAWFNDVVIESTYEGNHTKAVQRGLRYGIILFIVSEVIFFFGFFWAFFHSALNPSIFIGCIWPPKGIIPLETWNIPFLNTLILLSSGVAVTWSHLELLSSDQSTFVLYKSRFDPYKARFLNSNTVFTAHPTNVLTYYTKIKDPLKLTPENLQQYDTTWRQNAFQNAILGLALTLFYGVLFTLFQRYEYINAKFDISDSVYGSTFFIITGLHGLHVVAGTIFLSVQLARIVNYHLTPTHHFGYEAAIWYWHFVDVVWLFVFISVYFWSNYIA
jgi:heme/copper-type cytochrome/quinol oxidase subunit 3